MSALAVLALVLALNLAAPVAASPLEDGRAAYQRGDYAAALVILRPLAKQGDVRSILLRCSDPTYQQRNAVACKHAEDARALAAMPIELRMLMSKPEMAGSMRELCLSAQMGALRNSYLCAELYKAEAGFRQIADQYRTVPTTGGGSQELR